MPYIVHIKRLATSTVRTRVENSEWRVDSRLWTHGSRACDCARALLFAQDEEAAICACGISDYAIRVASADGTELYCEDAFEPIDEELLACDGEGEAEMIAGSPMGEGLGAFARQTLDRLAVQISQYRRDGRTAS